jgi:hypothetical protein
MDIQQGSDVGSRAVEVFVDDKKVVFETNRATGAQIKAKAEVPPDYSLYLRSEGRNEPIGAAEEVELKDGEHFFTRPPSNVS